MIYASETSNKQPSIDELKLGSDMEPREITSIIQHLIQRDLLQLHEKDEEGKFTEYMNLDGFYEKIKQYFISRSFKTTNKSSSTKF